MAVRRTRITLAKTAEGRQALVRLEEQNNRPKLQCNMDDRGIFLFFVGWVMMTGTLMFSSNLAIFVIGAIMASIPAVRSINLRKWVATRNDKKLVLKFRKDGTIFDVGSKQMSRWNRVIEEAGGDPNHDSLNPMKHWMVFDQLIEADKLLQELDPETTSDEHKSRIDKAMNCVIEKTVTQAIKQMQLEEAQVAEIAAAEMARKKELACFKVNKLVELMNDWPGDTISGSPEKQT